MPILHAIVLGIAQGLAEFLPISSSGHLILIPKLFGWTELTRDPALEKAFDVALHMGTLLAAIIAMRSECLLVVRGVWHKLVQRQDTTESTLAGYIILASIPAALVGLLFESAIDEHLGKPVLVGAMLVLFGVVLLWADGKQGKRPIESLTWKDSALIGVAQMLALQPGVSRSGITMTAGRFRGLDRTAAARFSFLLLIPITAGAGVVKLKKLIGDGGIPAGFGGAFLWGTVASAITGMIAITFLLRVLSGASFRPFVMYRVVAGLATIIIFATGIR